MPDDSVNALMPTGEFADTAQQADELDRAIALEQRIRNGDQFGNKMDAFRRGMLNFLGANQVPARAIRGAPFVSDDETARWRSSYPISYGLGQGAGAGAALMIDPVLGAGLTGAAIYADPGVQQTARNVWDLVGRFYAPAVAIAAAPYALLRDAFNASSNRNRLLPDEDQ
jgi:hypothetical protein